MNRDGRPAIHRAVELESYVPVRYTASSEVLEAWRFALEALGIPYEIVDLPETDGWSVYVPREAADQAREALRSTEEEVRAEAPKRARERIREEAARQDARENRLSAVPGVAFVLGLVFFTALAGFADAAQPSRWFDVGANALAQTRSGELWRAVTALTLHGSGEHLALNAIAAMFMLPLACEFWGVGVGIALTLLAGALGNVSEAFVSSHVVSVGASTALFGALGLAGGTRLLRRGTTRGDVFLIVTALVVMFGLFGIGDAPRDPLDVLFPGAPVHRSTVDVLAHVLGLLWGGLLGGVARKLVGHRPSLRAQGIAGAVAFAVVLGCWALALGHH